MCSSTRSLFDLPGTYHAWLEGQLEGQEQGQIKVGFFL